jgi:hypothetical protein
MKNEVKLDTEEEFVLQSQVWKDIFRPNLEEVNEKGLTK